ncbi:hypothetical protein [Shewanella algae]|uniref:hypothetical protein n=1 Tax=Shewanella algae TaxID=38313 RepID=UPI0031F5D84A
MAKSCSWARGVSTAVFLGEICGAGNGLHLAPRYRPRWPRAAAGPGVFLLQCFWERSAAPAMVSTRYRPRWPRVAAGPGVFQLQCSWESCGAGNGQHQVSASMAKSGSWARGISAAVFLGEICGAGNGQHQVSASMAKSGSWARGVSAAVFLGELRRRQWSAPGIGLDGQEWQLGPGYFCCSVSGRDLRRWQWSAPGIGLNGQEWQLGPGYFCCSVSGRDLRRWQW